MSGLSGSVSKALTKYPGAAFDLLSRWREENPEVPWSFYSGPLPNSDVGRLLHAFYLGAPEGQRRKDLVHVRTPALHRRSPYIEVQFVTSQRSSTDIVLQAVDGLLGLPVEQRWALILCVQASEMASSIYS